MPLRRSLLLIPAHNDEDAILQTVHLVLDLNYPRKEIVAIDDDSTDPTMQRLIDEFELGQVDLIYWRHVDASRPLACYCSTASAELLVISIAHGGKSAALNAPINVTRSRYVCTVDADCVIERDALLRLVRSCVSRSR